MSTVLITGAARGLGLDFTRQYAAKGWKIHACARKPDGLKGIDGRHPSAQARGHRLRRGDGAGEGTVGRGDRRADLQRRHRRRARQCAAGRGRSRGLAADFEVNTLAPLMMAEAFVEHVARSTERKLIAISSILGSIANNDGSRYVYRASKTALNMEWNCLARDLGAARHHLRRAASGLGADRHGRRDGDRSPSSRACRRW